MDTAVDAVESGLDMTEAIRPSVVQIVVNQVANAIHEKATEVARKQRKESGNEFRVEDFTIGVMAALEALSEATGTRKQIPQWWYLVMTGKDIFEEPVNGVFPQAPDFYPQQDIKNLIDAAIYAVKSPGRDGMKDLQDSLDDILWREDQEDDTFALESAAYECIEVDAYPQR